LPDIESIDRERKTCIDTLSFDVFRAVDEFEGFKRFFIDAFPILLNEKTFDDDPASAECEEGDNGCC